MADKRSGKGFNFIQPRRKIPKLDVSIVSSGRVNGDIISQPSTSTTSATSNRFPPAQQQQQRLPPTEAAQPLESENMWDDEDDDLIMRATQAVDNMMGDVPNMSFQDFQPNGKAPGASCSTQQILPAERHTNGSMRLPATSNKNALYTDIDTNMDLADVQCFSQQINDYMQNEQNSWMQYAGLAGNPAAGSKAPSGELPPELAAVNDGRAKATNACNFTQNLQNSREIQVKFLNAQLSQAQKDSAQLRLEVSKLNEKCQTKDGEIAMIRYDLQTHKKLQVNLRQDKLNEAERIKNEYTSKLTDLERSNVNQKTEIEYLKLQLLNLEARQHNTSSSISTTLPTISKQNTAINNDTLLMSLTRLHPYVRTVRRCCENDPPPRHDIAQSKHRPKNLLHEKAQCLQNFGQHLRVVSRINRDRYLIEIRQVVEQSLDIIVRDCSRLLAVCRPNDSRKIEFIVHNCDDELVQLARYRLLEARSLHHDGELFADEALRSGRCLLASLTSIAERDWYLCDSLFDVSYKSTKDGKNIADRLAAVLITIAASARWHLYLGVIEVAAQLLLITAHHYRDRKRNSWRSSQQKLLHAILMCRPGGKALRDIASFLLRMSAPLDLDPMRDTFLNTLCPSSPNYGICLDAPRRLQFSLTTCPMQFYALLLQSEFPVFCDRRQPVHDVLLADLTLDTLRFVQNGIDRPVAWMVKSTSPLLSRTDVPCRCYAQLVCASVVLMYQCLRRWILRPLDFDLKKIVAIAQTGIIFISDHFLVQYEKQVLRIGGPAVQQRLHVLFSWFQRYKVVFLFKRAHEKALLAIDHLRSNPHMFELLNNSGYNHDDGAMQSAPSAVAGIWSQTFSAIKLLRTKSDRSDINDEEPVY